MSQPIIKRDRIHVQAARAPEPVEEVPKAPEVTLLQAADPAPCKGAKGVRLLEEAGQVRGIEFTCSCGEITAVELVYPGDQTAQAAA